MLIVKLEQNRSRGQAFVGQLVNMDRDETIQAPFTLLLNNGGLTKQTERQRTPLDARM